MYLEMYEVENQIHKNEYERLHKLWKSKHYHIFVHV